MKINSEQWFQLLDMFLQRGTIKELSLTSQGMTYGFVKPRGRGSGRRERQPPPERSTVGVGADAPTRGTSDGVTPRAARPKGASSKPGQRRADAKAGRTHKGRRGAK